MAKLKSTTVSGTLSATDAVTASNFKLPSGSSFGDKNKPVFITSSRNTGMYKYDTDNNICK